MSKNHNKHYYAVKYLKNGTQWIFWFTDNCQVYLPYVKCKK